MSQRILTLYQALMDTADLHVTKDDFVSLKEIDEKGHVKYRPLTIKGQRLVLPTKAQKKNPDWEDRIAFHVLSEHIARGESPVMERYRQCLNVRLNSVIPILAMALLRIGASSGEHKKLNPDQSEFLSYVKNADQKTLDDFNKILENMPFNKPTQQFVNLYVRRSAKLEDVSFFRGGIVAFPFFEELSANKKVHGVELRKKDQATILALLDYILPHQTEPNYYSRGSNSRLAPTIDAVMKAFLAVAARLNDIVDLFGELLPEGLEIPAEWAEEFENLPDLVNDLRMMPHMSGNEGASAGGEPDTETDRVTDQPTPGLIQTSTRAPVPGMAPKNGPSAPPQPLQTRQHQPSPAKGGMTDLDSLLRSNPQLAAQAGYPIASGGWQQQRNDPNAGRAGLNNPVATASTGWNNSSSWGNQGGWNNQGGGGFRSGI